MITYKDDDTTVSGLELIQQKIRFFINHNGGYTPPMEPLAGNEILNMSASDHSLGLIEEEVQISSGDDEDVTERTNEVTTHKKEKKKKK